MSADLVFQFVNTAVLPAWLLLLILPRWRYTQAFAFGVIVPVLSVVYASVFAKVLAEGGGFDFEAFGSLEGVLGLLGERWPMVMGWAHYLAFDLFVGAWITRDAYANRVAHVFVLVPLFLTFMAGPVGLLLYLVVRQLRRGELLAEPTPFRERVASGADSGLDARPETEESL